MNHFVLRRAAWAGAALFPVLAACQQGEGTIDDPSAIYNKTASGHPESVVRLEVHGFPPSNGDFDPQAKPFIMGCHAVVVDRFYVLTAAHCFGGFTPKDLVVKVVNQSILPDAVSFHPSAWADGATAFDSARPDPNSVNAAYDLAMVRLELPVFDQVVARLWHPDPNTTLSLEGRVIRFGGHDDGFGQATGEETIIPYGSGGLLVGDRSPSGAQPGDSGGGAFLTLDDLPGSIPLGNQCEPKLGQAGDVVLVGINQSTDLESIDQFVPVFRDELVQWIGGFLGDVDGDGVCDGQDNCPDVANDQLNCNVIAERSPAWGSNGRELGDACDPAPCAHGTPKGTNFVGHSSDPFPKLQGGYLVTHTYGRAIEDELRLTPVIANNTAVIPYQTYFCPCRDEGGNPIKELAVCAKPPFNCVLDPMLFEKDAPEVPPSQAAAGGRAWYAMDTDLVEGTSPVKHPGEPVVYRWNFEADFAKWKAKGFVDALAPDPKFGPGTDLAGIVWIRTASGNFDVDSEGDPAGVQPHGIAGCPLWDDLMTEPCSISDSFVLDVAPDRRATQAYGKKIPVLAPAPWWTFCAPCGDEISLPFDVLFDPIPFLGLEPAAGLAILYKGGLELDVSAAFGKSLLSTLEGGQAKIVGASEPLAIANDYALPRAYVLSADGARLLGEIRGARGQLDLAGRELGLERAGRSGFGAAYSRTEGDLFVFGGTRPKGDVARELVIVRGQTVTTQRLAGEIPAEVQASVYSHRLRAIVLATPKGELGLLDPARGLARRLAGVDAGEAPELLSLEDGRVVLLAKRDGRAAVTVLEIEGDVARAAGSFELGLADARLTGVRGGEISIAVVAETREGPAVRNLALGLADLGLAPMSKR